MPAVSDVCVGDCVSPAAVQMSFHCLRQSLAPGAWEQGYISKRIRQNIPRPSPHHRSLRRQQGVSQLLEWAVHARVGCMQNDWESCLIKIKVNFPVNTLHNMLSVWSTIEADYNWIVLPLMDWNDTCASFWRNDSTIGCREISSPPVNVQPAQN